MLNQGSIGSPDGIPKPPPQGGGFLLGLDLAGAGSSAIPARSVGSSEQLLGREMPLAAHGYTSCRAWPATEWWPRVIHGAVPTKTGLDRPVRGVMKRRFSDALVVKKPEIGFEPTTY